MNIMLRPRSYLLLLGFACCGRLGAAQDETIKLDPYEVQADSDTSYGALNSNSITDFKTELNKMPISADIFDQTFMNDVGTEWGIEQMIQQFSAGAGFSSMTPDATAGAQQPGDSNSFSYVQLRGLATPSMQRDGLMIVGGWFQNSGVNAPGFSSTFDLDRVEIVNGPQALLYGPGGGGGVINTVSKQARFAQPASGSLRYEVDRYGHKQGQFDYNVGTQNLALRLAFIQQDVGGRRVNLGGPFAGYYGQLAARILRNTVVRVQWEESTFDRLNSKNLTLTAASTANDARNGQELAYLMATNQINAAANGAPSGAGVIANGLLTWDNLSSYSGQQARDFTINRYMSISADTVWSDWLTTKIAAGYDAYIYDDVSNGTTFYAPNSAANPLGTWAVAEAGGVPMTTTEQLSRMKSLRATALVTNDLFGGLAHSETNLGADYVRGDNSQTTYEYYDADSSFNIVYGGPAANGGRTIVPKVYWPVASGFLKYPLWSVGTKQVTYGGANYVLAPYNPIDPSLISPSNPLGVTLNLSGGGQNIEEVINKGVFGVNDTTWMQGRLNTLFGFRLASSNETSYYATGLNRVLSAKSTDLDFNAGVNYAILPWLRPYVTISDSIDPPLVQDPDPFGVPVESAHALGEELGIKVQNAAGTISGSLATYRTRSKNEEYILNTAVLNDINPSGLNGRYNNPNSTAFINVPRETEGIQATFTASPSSAWRVRLSAAVVKGTIGGDTSYSQAYNDQFNENAAGQVTYANGTVVYVAGGATSAASAKEVTSTTAGAVPLTVQLMSTASSLYYANPLAVTGQIMASSNVGKILLTPMFSTANGPILTGRAGLPISNIQINPGFTPPGTIVTSVNGDSTTGYPEYSMNATSMYTVASGFAKGLRVGGSLQLGWTLPSYYYYVNGIAPGAQRKLFLYPNVANFSPIVGYGRKFKRYGWSTQLNINNVFNHYHVVILPNVGTGYGGILNATFDQQPRTFNWSSSITF